MIDTRRGAEGPLGGSVQNLAVDAGLALTGGGIEDPASGGEEGFVVGGAYVVRVGTGQNQEMRTDGVMPANRGSEFGGGIVSVAGRRFRGAAGSDAGEGLTVMLFDAPETEDEGGDVGAGDVSPETGAVDLKRRAVVAVLVEKAAAEEGRVTLVELAVDFGDGVLGVDI